MGTFPPLLRRWTKSDLPSVPGVGLRLKRLFWRLFLGDASLASPTPSLFPFSHVCLPPPALPPPPPSRFFSIKHLYRLSKEASLPLKHGDFSSYYSVSDRCCHASLEAQSQPWGPLFPASLKGITSWVNSLSQPTMACWSLLLRNSFKLLYKCI